MPRNSSGVYTPPAGNPVVTDTTITSSWANLLVNDLATQMTSSLDRSGRGGMLAPLKGFDGSSGVPGYGFTAEATTGMFRAGAGELGFSVLGNQKALLDALLLELDVDLTVNGVTDLNGPINSTGLMTHVGDLVVDGIISADPGVEPEDVATVAQLNEVSNLWPGAAGLTIGEVYDVTAGFTLNTDLVLNGVYGIYNNSANQITITQGSGLTLRLSGSVATGNRYLAPHSLAFIWVRQTTEIILSGSGAL